MRDLGKSERNRLLAEDPFSGKITGIYYKTPTTSQMLKFRSESFGKRGVMDGGTFSRAAIRAASDIITGFDENYLVANGDGKYVPVENDPAFGVGGVPISSDPESPHYRPDWKNLLLETAPDVLELLGSKVFGGGKAVREGDGEDDDALPLGKSSGD